MDARSTIPQSVEFLTTRPRLPLPAPDGGCPLDDISAGSKTDLHLDWFLQNASDFHPAHRARIRLLSPEDAAAVQRHADETIPPGWPESSNVFPEHEVLNYHHITRDDPHADLDAAVRQWLYNRGIPFGRRVFLLMDGRYVFQLPWRLVVRYWRVFDQHCGFASYVIDQTKAWALCFHHESFMLIGWRGQRRRLPNDQ